MASKRREFIRTAVSAGAVMAFSPTLSVFGGSNPGKSLNTNPIIEEGITNEYDLAFTPALKQAELVRLGKVSPVELVELYLKRIEVHNPKLNAYITVAADFARQAARDAEKRIRQENCPPFNGVPISIKDLNATAGIRTTMGSASLKNNIPEEDCWVVTRLKEAGFIILGKTNTPEFGGGVFTEPVGYGACRNPWDLRRTPGGSSGGAAAALAAGLCPISHGSDGGGSIRIPSAWSGVFGIKPSRGRVSAAPNPQDMFSVNGPIARTVADAASMLDVMTGHATGDAFWAPTPERPFLKEVGRNPGRLRIAFTHRFESVEVAAANRNAVEQTAALLAALGHEVTEDTPPWLAINEDHPVFHTYEAMMAASEADLPPFETLDPIIQGFIERGRGKTIRDLVLGDRIALEASRKLVGFFDSYDILVTPTVAVPAPMIGAFRDPDHPWEAFLRVFDTCPFTANWNMTGQPAVSLPLYTDEQGLPVGVQLVGRPTDEATLIRVSAQLEEALPWIGRRPPEA